MKKSKQRKADRRLAPIRTEQLGAVSGGGSKHPVEVLLVGSKIKSSTP